MMKRTLMLVLFLVFVMASAVVQAEEEAPLERGQVLVKVGYIHFSDDFFDHEDSGIYMAIEGYGKIFPNVYLGGELGVSGNLSVFGGDDVTTYPFELNCKYAKDVGNNFIVDFGGGVSYNRVVYKDTSIFSPSSDEKTEWLFGGQLFADINYMIRMVSIGANVKYQITQDFPDNSWSPSNLRVAPHLGIVF